jgi:hypothetical protein
VSLVVVQTYIFWHESICNNNTAAWNPTRLITGGRRIASKYTISVVFFASENAYLSASLMHASMYGSFDTESRVISSEFLKLDRTSFDSLSNKSGCFKRKYVTPLRSVAVVSEPPRMSRLAFACICSMVRLCCCDRFIS